MTTTPTLTDDATTIQVDGYERELLQTVSALLAAMRAVGGEEGARQLAQHTTGVFQHQIEQIEALGDNLRAGRDVTCLGVTRRDDLLQ